MCGKDDDPPPTNYMGQARAEIAVERERARLAEEQRVKQEMRDAAERTRLQGEFDTSLGEAYNRSLGYAQQRVGERGLNWDDFASSITGELDRTRASVPNRDTNPGSYFGDDLVDRVLGRIRDNRRAQYGQQVEQFAPNSFERQAIGDNFDDSIIDSIYNEQYGDANSMLDRAFARGNLSSLGMSSARRELDTQGRAGRSRLQDLGGGVLSNYRSELTDVGNRARSRAANYDLGQTFSLDPFLEEITGKKNSFNERLEGDVRNATRGENLFNVEEIIGKGGRAQGLYNPSTADQIGSSPIFDTLKQRGDLRRKQRGLEVGSY